MDGSARLNSLGLWSVDTIGLTPPDSSTPDVFEENHDICLVADLLSGGTLTLSLNDNTNTTAVGNFRHEGRIDPEDTNDLPNTIFKLAIQIYHDPTEEAGLCAGTVVQVTGLTIIPF